MPLLYLLHTHLLKLFLSLSHLEIIFFLVHKSFAQTRHPYFKHVAATQNYIDFIITHIVTHSSEQVWHSFYDSIPMTLFLMKTAQSNSAYETQQYNLPQSRRLNCRFNIPKDFHGIVCMFKIYACIVDTLKINLISCKKKPIAYKSFK